MMADAPAPRFADFDLDVMDQLRAKMDIVLSLIDTAIDHVDHDKNRASNLMFAALDLWKGVDREAGEIHSALCASQEVERNAGSAALRDAADRRIVMGRGQ